MVMASGNFPASAAHAVVHHPASATSETVKPLPTKRDLTSWWKSFQKLTKKEGEKAVEIEPPSGIFGVPLQVSIKYANVAISLTDERGESFVYGYVPIVVAKCGVFLKEKALNVEGIFRLNGSAKRIKELQAIFDSPDRYGKGLDWNGYTVHDAANVLRRYLNQLPQPIVPLDFYERCRDPLRTYQQHMAGDTEGQGPDVGDFDHNAAIATYQRVIKELPPLNRQLLLYILDLLAVFAAKAELNRMTSTNLAAIFQPGMLSHPAHDMVPDEYLLSQEVLVFLIENQDSFLVGMSGTGVDDKTVQEVQSGGRGPRNSQSPSTPRNPQAALGRSASNASGGADSLRKYGVLRRNVSISSKHSKGSTPVPSPIPSIPGSPHTGVSPGIGIHRSNTLPSKKSPGLSSRFNKPNESPSPTPATLSPTNRLAPTAHTASSGSRMPHKTSEGPSPSTTSSLTPTLENTPVLPIAEELNLPHSSNESLQPSEQLNLRPPQASESQTSFTTPKGERKSSGLFSKSPTGEYERGDSRQPNRLRKKRPAGSSSPSTHSSTQSLHGRSESQPNQIFYTPMPTPGPNTPSQEELKGSAAVFPSNIDARQVSEIPTQVGDGPREAILIPLQELPRTNAGYSLKPSDSPSISVRSRASVTDFSEASHPDDTMVAAEHEKKKRRWRFSSPPKNNIEVRTALSASSQRGRSNTSVESSSKPRKSITHDSQQHSANPLPPPQLQTSSNETTPSKDKGVIRDHDHHKEQSEKKGPIGWFRAKVAQVKEERKERETEKERAKSPPRNNYDQARHTQNLLAIPPQGIEGREPADTKPRPSHDESEMASRPQGGGP